MGKWVSTWSSFLFARSSWMEGMARTIDLGGTLQEYNYTSDGQDADAIAMMADWQMIGDDLRRAIKAIDDDIEEEIGEHVLIEAYEMLQNELDESLPGISNPKLLFSPSEELN